jgi:hypothetical protein
LKAVPKPFKEASGASSDIILPFSYTDIRPCILPSVVVPLVDFSININDSITDDDFAWLNTVEVGMAGTQTFHGHLSMQNKTIV